MNSFSWNLRPPYLGVNAILQQALDRSPAYGSMQEILDKLQDDEVKWCTHVGHNIIVVSLYIHFRNQLKNKEMH